MRPLLIIDAPNLAHASFHVTGHLHNGVIYGVLSKIGFLAKLFRSNRFVFCFDRGQPKRVTLCPGYKANRVYTEEQAAGRAKLHGQLRKLRKEVLPALGFANVFAAQGYEADDLIAAIADDCRCEAIIVSTDRDLYQCIGNSVNGRSVSVFRPVPGELIDLEKFRSMYEIEPRQWADVKALAGCKSDGVKGIKGVGEKTACRFMAKTLAGHTATYTKIAKQAGPIFKQNLGLVALPFDGTPTPELQEDRLTEKRWSKATKGLGMASLRWPGDF